MKWKPGARKAMNHVLDEYESSDRLLAIGRFRTRGRLRRVLDAGRQVPAGHRLGHDCHGSESIVRQVMREAMRELPMDVRHSGLGLGVGAPRGQDAARVSSRL
jgi:hypothetical protein